MQSSKKMQNQQVLINPSMANAEKQIAVEPQAEKPATVTAQQPKKLVGGLIKTHSSGLKTRSFAKLALNPILIKNVILNKVEKQVAVVTASKNRALTSYKHTSGSEFEGSIRRAIICLVIALIFYLIAAFLPWPADVVLNLIGTIFLIVGIIYLLFWLLRDM